MQRYQVSLRAVLMAVMASAIPLGAWVNFRPTRHFSCSRYQSLPHVLVPEDFDLEELRARINCQQFVNELAEENPMHERLIRAKWDETASGIDFQFAERGGFQMVITYPAYEIRRGTVGWGVDDLSLWKSKLGIEVAAQNEAFRLAVLRKVYEHLDELSAGNLEVSP